MVIPNLDSILESTGLKQARQDRREQFVQNPILGAIIFMIVFGAMVVQTHGLASFEDYLKPKQITQGKITQLEIQEDKNRFKSVISYTYQVDSKDYVGTRIQKTGEISDYQQYIELLQFGYAKGDTVDVYYDANDHQDSFLKKSTLEVRLTLYAYLFLAGLFVLYIVKALLKIIFIVLGLILTAVIAFLKPPRKNIGTTNSTNMANSFDIDSGKQTRQSNCEDMYYVAPKPKIVEKETTEKPKTAEKIQEKYSDDGFDV